MFIQKVKASALALGAALVAVSLSVPAAMAQPVSCPCLSADGKNMTSKIIDGWYKDVGFDTSADDVTGNCPSGSWGATLDDVELAPFEMVYNGDTVVGLRTGKSIMVDLQYQSTGGMGSCAIEAIVDGVRIQYDNANYLSEAEVDACISALTSSQAWKRWVCGK